MSDVLTSIKNKLEDIDTRLSKLESQKNIFVSAERDDKKDISMSLGYVSVICFLLAISFLAKLAIDTYWFDFSPERQLTIGAILGSSLIVGGFSLKNRNSYYAGILPAVGIVLLYLVVYGGSIHYELLSPDKAIFMVCAISVYAVYLLRNFNTLLFSFISVLGTYICPFWIMHVGIDIYHMGLYFVLWAIVFSCISIINKNRLIHLLACYLSISSLGLVNVFQEVYTSYYVGNLIPLILFVQFACLAVGLFGYSYINKVNLKEEESWYYFPVLVFFYFVEYQLLVNYYSGDNSDFSKKVLACIPYVGLAFAAFCFGLKKLGSYYFNTANRKGLRNIVYSFAAIVVAHSLYLNILPAQYSFLVSILIFFTILFSYKTLQENPVAAFVTGVILIREYIVLSIGLHVGKGYIEIIYGALFVTAIFFLYFKEKDKKLLKNFHEYQVIILLLGHFLAASTIYSLGTIFGLSDYFTSALIVLYASIFLGVTLQRKDFDLTTSCLIIFILALCKLFIYDSYDEANVVRLGSLIAVFACFIGSGYLMKKIQVWND